MKLIEIVRVKEKRNHFLILSAQMVITRFYCHLNTRSKETVHWLVGNNQVLAISFCEKCLFQKDEPGLRDVLTFQSSAQFISKS